MAAPMRWAMIDSVPDKELMPQLTEFGNWLLGNLQTEGIKKGVPCAFESEPDVVFYAKPDCYEDVEVAYKNLFEKHGRVLLVIHVLPRKNSREYEWMKSLSGIYALIAQGILLENAISRFADLSQEMIIENMLKWISRRLHEIILAHQSEQRSFALCVGAGTIPQRSRLDMNEVERAVQHVLNEAVPIEHKVLISSVRVEGFPSTMNQYHLAAVFADFIVRSVEIYESDNYAIVEFTTKFQAAQAAMMYNGWNVDSAHKLSVIPMHPEKRKGKESTIDAKHILKVKAIGHMSITKKRR